MSRQKERKRLAVENVLSVYDITLSPAENVRYLETEHNISICLSTLYSYFKEYEIDYKVYKVIKHEKKMHDIQLCLVEMENSNTTITIRALKKHLKQKGIKANTNDCCRYYDQSFKTLDFFQQHKYESKEINASTNDHAAENKVHEQFQNLLIHHISLSSVI